MKYELVPFHEFEQDEPYGCFTNILETIDTLDGDMRAESAEWFSGCAVQIIRYAESAGIGGSVWTAWLAKLFAEAENPFSLAHERREVSGGTMARLAADDMEQIYSYLKCDLARLEDQLIGRSVEDGLGAAEDLQQVSGTFDSYSGCQLEGDVFEGHGCGQKFISKR